MTNKSGDIGTWTAQRVVEVLEQTGWPNAERRSLHGAFDRGDIVGCPGLVWEVKGGHRAENASDADIVAWLGETEVERHNANAAYGILVWKRKAVGRANARRWWAAMWSDQFAHLGHGSDQLELHEPFPVRMTLADAIVRLRAAGWGDQIDEVPA